MRAAARSVLVFLLLAASTTPTWPGASDERVVAPPFSGVTLSGKAVSLDSILAGKPYAVLTFFGVNCLPCQKKIVQLNELSTNERFSEKAQIYAINADGFNSEKLAGEMSRRGISIDFPVIPDDNQVITNLYVDGVVPLTILIDNNCRIVMTTMGARPESIRKLADRVILPQEAGSK